MTPDRQALIRRLNGAAADSLRIVANVNEGFRLGLWFCIGWLDGGR